MMKKIIVLGAGLIGKTIAIDLKDDYDVTCADIHEPSLQELSSKHQIKTICCDFSSKEKLTALIKPFDLVVGSVPGFMGYNTLKNCIEAGKNIVDISFFPEDPLTLDALAKSNNVTAIVDCGVAPGMCNVIAGYHHSISTLTFYECLVGGLPLVREWPFEYKAVFSPIDVLEEYTRPARYVENGCQITREALSDAEYVNFEQVGTLESFNTDGLRTLADTMPNVPNMKEKTLRYPGHIELMRVFREAGFFDKKTIKISGSDISPLEFTSKLLFPKWKLKEGEEDFTVMRITVSNQKGTFEYSLLDFMDKKSRTTSMARTTGYTCTAAVNLLLKNKFSRKGVCPPEYIGEADGCYDEMLNYLKKRNIEYKVVIKQNTK